MNAMGKIRFVLNSDGVRELLKSAEMQSVINSAAEQVKSRAEELSGLEFETSSTVGRTRCSSRVSPASIHAYHKAMKDNIMEKAKRSVKI